MPRSCKYEMPDDSSLDYFNWRGNSSTVFCSSIKCKKSWGELTFSSIPNGAKSKARHSNIIAVGAQQIALNSTMLGLWSCWSIFASLRKRRLSSFSVPNSFLMTTRSPLAGYFATKTEPKEPLPISSWWEIFPSCWKTEDPLWEVSHVGDLSS